MTKRVKLAILAAVILAAAAAVVIIVVLNNSNKEPATQIAPAATTTTEREPDVTVGTTGTTLIRPLPAPTTQATTTTLPETTTTTLPQTTTTASATTTTTVPATAPPNTIFAHKDSRRHGETDDDFRERIGGMTPDPDPIIVIRSSLPPHPDGVKPGDTAEEFEERLRRLPIYEVYKLSVSMPLFRPTEWKDYEVVDKVLMEVYCFVGNIPVYPHLRGTPECARAQASLAGR